MTHDSELKHLKKLKLQELWLVANPITKVFKDKQLYIRLCVWGDVAVDVGGGVIDGGCDGVVGCKCGGVVDWRCGGVVDGGCGVVVDFRWGGLVDSDHGGVVDGSCGG